MISNIEQFFDNAIERVKKEARRNEVCYDRLCTAIDQSNGQIKRALIGGKKSEFPELKGNRIVNPR